MSLGSLFKSWSFLGVLVAIVFISSLRLSHINSNETSWDVLGYYLPLPATFIYDDAKMDNPEWIQEVNDERNLTGTLYQVSTTPDGKPMYFFLFGMSLFYLPFFLMGHGWASLSGVPPDGFSEPYQISLVFGGIIYTFIGLVLLRKIILHFYSEKVAFLAILTTVFATNYVHHLSFKNLETVNVLFMLVCWLVWSTIKWHQEKKLKQFIQIGIAITLMTLVKPSEVLAVLIPVFWGVNSKSSFFNKLKLIWEYRNQLFITIFFALVLLSPQLYYWHIKTGHWIYDSYKNPGIGLDITHPHLIDVLFSLRKGWLVYTPVMIIGLFGLFVYLRKKVEVGFGLIIYFVVAFYLLASWTEWWYGAAFSCRPVITSYPILALGIAAVYNEVNKQSLKWGLAGFVLLCTFLNLFQWWQLMAGIYDPYRTTPSYYAAIFLQTKAPKNAEELKLVYRSFEPGYKWTDQYRYKEVFSKQIQLSKNVWVNDEFTNPQLKIPFEKLTSKDHLWIELEIEYELKDSSLTYGPFVVLSAMHKGESYGYVGEDIRMISDTVHGKVKAKLQYLTPEMRRTTDDIFTYVWNPSKNQIKINSYKVKCFERKH